MRYETIILEKGTIAKITLNRPNKLNALNTQLKKELIAAIDEIKKDPSTRVVVFSGAGRSFCAGQDVSETVSYKAEDAKTWIKGYEDLYDAIRGIDVPTIVAIKGYAVGAGLQVALLMDLKIAAEDATLGLTEINVGIPCITGSQILYMLGMPLCKVAEMIMLGLDGLISGKEAAQYGLVNKAVPAEKLDETVQSIAEKIASYPPVAESLNKGWLRELTKKPLKEAAKYAAIAHTKAFASGEPQKAMADFLSKKKK